MPGLLSRATSFSVSAVANSTPGSSIAASSAFVNISGVRAVRVKELIDKIIPKKCYSLLEAILPKVKDERLRARKPSASNSANKKDEQESSALIATRDAVSLAHSKEINALRLTQPIYANEMFGQIAHELLNQLVVSIFQAEVRGSEKQ